MIKMIKNVMMTLKKFDPIDLSQITSLWNWIGNPSKMVLRIMKVWLLQQQPNLMWSKSNFPKAVKLNFAWMLRKLNDHRASKENQLLSTKHRIRLLFSPREIQLRVNGLYEPQQKQVKHFLMKCFWNSPVLTNKKCTPLLSLWQKLWI